MSGDASPVWLGAEDAVELGELLGFLGDWLEGACGVVADSLTGLCGGGYGVEELSVDVARFVFLLGGDGGRFVFGDDR